MLKRWLFRYKLYHLFFWCFYHYLWWTVAIGNPLTSIAIIVNTHAAAKFIFYVVFQAAAVYINLYVLMPRFLEKNRVVKYITWLGITLLATAVLIIPGYYISAWLAGSTVETLYGVPGNINLHLFITNSLPSTIASMTLAMSIKLTKNWIQTKRRQQLLEKEKLESELKFLKYQFNPHFLFNTINSIFFLIHRNPNMASASLAKFSELLRYQLYECNDTQIGLNKEITYLENFIQLEKLRQNENVEVVVSIDNAGTGHLAIAPFILMTFVENAFKHVSKHTDKPNWIKIKLSLQKGQLNFSIANSTAGYTFTEVVGYGGIGLNNVRRRLDLLYFGKHHLLIQTENDSFSVNLQLSLAELVMYEALQKTA
jgi:sensor histidine kinase YesM